MVAEKWTVSLIKRKIGLTLLTLDAKKPLLSGMTD
jgi:hypothetical protein